MKRVLADAALRSEAADSVTSDDRLDLRALWLVRLRWGAFAAEVVVIVAAREVFGLDLPVATLLALASLIAITNTALAWRLRQRHAVPRSWLGWIAAFDTLQLTALLFVSGGTSNPFSVFYLVQITIAAVALGSRWTWCLAVLGVSSYAVLFMVPSAGGAASQAHMAHGFERHLQAMWIALTLSAALTAYFVTRLTNLVVESEQKLAEMREIAARHERLASLSTLAAGAAHQLGTPLATVAVAAGELARAVAALPSPQAQPLVDDIRLIRAELQRSREILDGMAGDAGHAAGEMPATVKPREVMRDVVDALARTDRPRVIITDRAADARLFLPRRAVARVVLSLVQNALDAALPPAVVAIDIDAEQRLRLRIRDQGPGMAPDVLARAGEPFFTTKAPGRGLGLGLFLARSLADHLGGRLTLDSTDHGTTATLELPLQLPTHDHPA